MKEHLNNREPYSMSGETKQERTLTVYLAGGFHSGWQKVVRDTAQRFCYLDPREHNLAEKTQYTFWDLEAIRRSDIVFAYFESTNPAGYSLALEVGYAKALEKHVILVDEKSSMDETTNRYMGMVQVCADVVVHSFEEGLNLMSQLETIVPQD